MKILQPKHDKVQNQILVLFCYFCILVTHIEKNFYFKNAPNRDVNLSHCDLDLCQFFNQAHHVATWWSMDRIGSSSSFLCQESSLFYYKFSMWRTKKLHEARAPLQIFLTTGVVYQALFITASVILIFRQCWCWSYQIPSALSQLALDVFTHYKTVVPEQTIDIMTFSFCTIWTYHEFQFLGFECIFSFIVRHVSKHK